MSESKKVLKILKKTNIIHNYNYSINKKYNVIVKKYMKKIVIFKKEKNVSIYNIKNLIEHLANIFKVNVYKLLIYIICRVERNFV